MHPIVELLVRQIPPPQPTSASRIDLWPDVEAKLGLTLPRDYKNIIEIYGDYGWAGFLYLLNPFSGNKYLNLLTRLEVILDAERQLREINSEHYPLPLYPELGGLLPLLITDNGDTGFWITQAAAEKWPILLKEARAPEFEVHFFSTAMFLYQFSGGRLESLVLPKCFSEDVA